MDLLLVVSGLLIAVVLLFVIVVRHLTDRAGKLDDRVRELESSKQSLATTYGRITEQWAPFLSDYPHDPKDFRFLGSPVDGVQFNEDGIVFVEIKTNSSRLNARQKRLREHVEAGRVSWLEVRIDERPRGLEATGTGNEV